MPCKSDGFAVSNSHHAKVTGSVQCYAAVATCDPMSPRSSHTACTHLFHTVTLKQARTHARTHGSKATHTLRLAATCALLCITHCEYVLYITLQRARSMSCPLGRACTVPLVILLSQIVRLDAVHGTKYDKRNALF